MINVAIACPHWGQLNVECHAGMMQIAKALTPWPPGNPDGQFGIGRLDADGESYALAFLYAAHTNIPIARETLVEQALERDAHVSVHVDSDTGFDLEHVLELIELLRHHEDAAEVSAYDEGEVIVCAAKPICLRGHPHHIAAFPFPVTQTPPHEWWFEVENRKVVDVAATGMGLCAFRMDALEEIERPWFPLHHVRFGAPPVSDMPLWLLHPQAALVGSDVAFTSRMAQVGRCVIDNRWPTTRPVRHIVPISLAPFEQTVLTPVEEEEDGPGEEEEADRPR